MSARRLPNGWIVLGGSVLASFVWWLALQPSRRAEPTPVAAPQPVEVTPAPATTPATPARPVTPSPEPRATQDTPVSAPAPAPSVAGPLLRVIGDVAGADVFVDRAFVGKAPFETRDIKAGSHQINVSADGFDGISRQVEVSAGAPTEVVFSLTAVVLDSAVQVVHKHRLGACKGRLSADLTGVRYAPTGGDDGFHAPLTELEAFSLDYRAKVLTLKVKGGKRFTFTTRAANADPLHVFHRDVEKARTKLVGGA